MRFPHVTHRLLLALAFTLTVAGCAPPPSTPLPSGDKYSAEQGMLLSNNAASLSGVVRGPATLLSNNAASFRVQAFEQVPAAKALVYLTAPDERFYAGSDGKALHTVTDSDGRYAFATAPAGEPVVVTILFSHNRRMVGFMIPKEGANTYDVDVATTVVAEFLRDQARLAGKSMADYSALATELPGIISKTRELLASGKMALPDLGVNAIPAMRHAYVAAFGADHQELSDAWKRLLGYRPLLLDELDAGLAPGHNALAVHVDGDEIYTAGFNNYHLQIRRRKADGSVETVTEAPRAEWIDYVGGMIALNGLLHVGAPTGAGHGHYGFDLDTPFDPEDWLANNPIWSQHAEPGGSPKSFHAFDLAAHGGYFYASSDGTNEIVRYKLDEDTDWGDLDQIAEDFAVIAGSRDAQATFAGDAPLAGSQARFNYPTGLTVQRQGDKDYLYVADKLNHRIRRIDLSPGGGFKTETVLGHGLGATSYGNILKPPGALEDGKLTASKAAGFVDLDHPDGIHKDKASFAYPQKVIFDPQGRMFIADQDHKRVRMFDGSKVYTLAGTNPGVPSAIGDSRRSGLGEVTGIAFDKDGNLLIADGRSNKLRRLWLKFGL